MYKNPQVCPNYSTQVEMNPCVSCCLMNHTLTDIIFFFYFIYSNKNSNDIYSFFLIKRVGFEAKTMKNSKKKEIVKMFFKSFNLPER